MEDSSDPCWMLVVVTFGVRRTLVLIVTVPMNMIRRNVVLIVGVVVRCHGRNCPVNCW
jgi:hypothetical protein